MNEKEIDLIKLIKSIDPETKNWDLRMHKILYFSYIFYYKITEKELFDPNFRALSYGPLEIDYREHFSHESKLENIDKNTKEKFKIKLEKFDFKTSKEAWNPDTTELITFIIETFLKNIDTWDLVNFSQITSPWIESSYNDKNKNMIQKKELNKYAKDAIMNTYNSFFDKN